MIVEEKYPLQNIQEYFPLVCTEEPAPGSAFCSTHSKLVKDCGYETNLKKFITSCGANPSNYTRVERDKVKEVLKTLLRTTGNRATTETAEVAQGTAFLLNNSEVTNAANLQFEDRPDEENCTKDTGQKVRLHNWTRGIFQVVGPGGIILYWSNLYSSEGPHQSAYIMIKYLSLQLKGWTAEEYRNFFISYDNMCAIDGLNLLKKPLPLAAPEDRLWLNTRHLIALLVNVVSAPVNWEKYFNLFNLSRFPY